MSVSQKEKIFFAEHLSLLIKGGIPISESIETLRDESKSPVFRKILNDVLKRILEGQKLSKSLEFYPKIFNKFFCSLVRIGEESGTLEESLKYLAQHLRSNYEMEKKIKGALIYPLIVIVVAFFIAFAVTFFVLPKITDLFQILKIELPLATRILIKTATFLKNYFLLLAIFLILLFFLFKIVQKLNSFKFYFDKIALSSPFVGQIFKNIGLARFSQTFFTLLKSGIPVLESFEICIDSHPNNVFKKYLILTKSRVEGGERISQSLKGSPRIFPSIFTQMIAIGEKSGTLEESLLYLTHFYEEEVESTLKNLAGILEPVLLILVGIFVAFISLAVIIPIYRFVGALRFR